MSAAILSQSDMPAVIVSFTDRLRTANRVFKTALLVNAALTAFCILSYATGIGSSLVGSLTLDAQSVRRVLFGILFFNVAWGFVWYGIKNLLLKYLAGFSKEERRAAFSSRMSQPYEVADLLARHSERRIRIIDMIGRRGRFITLGMAGLFYCYTRVKSEPSATFATAFLSDNLLDGVVTSWLFVGLFYVSGAFVAALYGPQSRVMDGVLARANCLSIITLWTLFKFVLVPIGYQLAKVYPPEQFALVFALIWGSYMVADTLAEVGGALYGRQRIRVLGIGDVNRKSIAGTVTGFVSALIFCIGMVMTYHMPTPWLGLALVLAVSNTLLELVSPRGTDDFTMTTANALICWAFGAWMMAG